MEPLLTDGASLPVKERFAIPPWVFQVTLDEKMMEAGRQEAAVSFSLGYVILAAVLIYLCRRNLEDDALLRSVAIGMTTLAWAALTLICIPRIPLWASFWQWMTAFATRSGLVQNRIVLGLWGLMLKQFGLLRSGSGAALEGLRRLTVNWKHLFVSTTVLTTTGGSLGVRDKIACTRVSTLVRAQKLGEVAYWMNVPGITAVQLNYFSMTPYLGADNAATVRGLTDTMALGYTCGTCYTDLCFDAMLESNLAVCADPAWAARVRDLRVQQFVQSRYKKETNSKPAWPKWWIMVPRKFLVFITLAKLWGITDSIPSLLNEIKEDVSISETIWRATTVSFGMTTLIPIIVAVAFPGLVKLRGSSPFALIANNFLPPHASNLLLLVFAFCTIVPGKSYPDQPGPLLLRVWTVVATDLLPVG